MKERLSSIKKQGNKGVFFWGHMPVSPVRGVKGRRPHGRLQPTPCLSWVAFTFYRLLHCVV